MNIVKFILNNMIIRHFVTLVTNNTPCFSVPAQKIKFWYKDLVNNDIT